MTDRTPTSPNHPTVDLPAHLEGPRLPTSYTPTAGLTDAEWEAIVDAGLTALLSTTGYWAATGADRDDIARRIVREFPGRLIRAVKDEYPS